MIVKLEFPVNEVECKSCHHNKKLIKFYGNSENFGISYFFVSIVTQELNKMII